FSRTALRGLRRASPAAASLSLHDALPIFAGQPESLAHADNLVRGQRARTEAALMPASVHLRFDAHPGLAAHIQRPDTLGAVRLRSEEHTSELQSRENLVCRLLLEKKKQTL